MDREPIPGECVVCRVDDSDDTLRGIPQGKTYAADFWIPWSDVEPVPFGWEFARQAANHAWMRAMSCVGFPHADQPGAS